MDVVKTNVRYLKSCKRGVCELLITDMPNMLESNIEYLYASGATQNERR